MLALTLTLLLHADPLPVEKSAKIELEQTEAQQAVNAKYGNKKPSELTPSETRAKIRDQAAADREVLEKNGVSEKEWARDSLKKDRSQFAEEKVAVKALAQKKKADAEAAAKPVAAPQEIQIQRGINEEHPVILEEAPGAAPIIENGLPPDALADQAAAQEADGSAPKVKGGIAKKSPPTKSRPPPPPEKKKKTGKKKNKSTE